MTYDVEPLTWKRPPHHGEPVTGYASRLAALNGIDLPALASATGIPLREILGGREDAVSAVSRLGGLNTVQIETLSHATPRLRGRLDADLAGERMVWGGIHTTFFRYCPHCVAQDLVKSERDIPMAARPWLRVEWLIDQVRSCRAHGVLLMESGRVGLGQSLDFSLTMATDILPRLDDLRAGTQPAAPNPFEDWVVRRLTGTRDPGSWLDRMPLHAAVSACEAIGVSALHQADVRVRELTMQDWATASLEGHGIASEGRAGIDRFLDTLVERATARGVVGMRETYGYLLRSLNRSVDDTAFAPVLDVVREHIFSNVPLEPGSSVLGQVLDRKRVHSIHSAALAAGTTSSTMRRMLARSGMDLPSADGDERTLTRAAVSASPDIEAVIAGRADTVGSTEVCEATGITRKHLAEFVSRGLLLTANGSARGERAKLRFRKADIEAFSAKLFEGAETVERPSPRQVKVGAARNVASAAIGDVLALLVDGRLSWKGSLRGGRRFEDLLVDADEVRGLLRAEPPKRGLSKKEVEGVAPGLRHEVVLALVARGHLDLVEEFCPVNRRRIPVVTRESVEAFMAKYVTVAEVGKLKGIPARMALRLLREAGVKAAFDVSTANAWIYERADVLAHTWPDRV